MPHCKAGLLLLALFAPWGAAPAQRIFANGFNESCLADSDGDRLDDCQELARALALDRPDTDGDGLNDGDEVLGTIAGLDLPGMGTDPRHKDLLVEMDWADDAFECAQHSHRPTDQVIDEVRQFFASVPVANVDGVPGINFIADHGQGGAFTGGNYIAIPNGITSALEAPFYQWKAQNMAPERVGYVRYQLHGHRMNYGSGYSGRGDIGGDHSVITLGCLATPQYVRNTIIHELGHNMSLRHGGDTDCHRKLNYNSLMNYNHQLDGVDTDCDTLADGVDLLGYSDGSRNSLIQGQLSEPAGVCRADHPAHQPIDWNANGVIDPGLVISAAPLNYFCAQPNEAHDHDDHAALVVSPYLSQNGAPPGDPPEDSGDCAPLPSIDP